MQYSAVQCNRVHYTTNKKRQQMQLTGRANAESTEVCGGDCRSFCGGGVGSFVMVVILVVVVM